MLFNKSNASQIKKLIIKELKVAVLVTEFVIGLLRHLYLIVL